VFYWRTPPKFLTFLQFLFQHIDVWLAISFQLFSQLLEFLLLGNFSIHYSNCLSHWIDCTGIWHLFVIINMFMNWMVGSKMILFLHIRILRKFFQLKKNFKTLKLLTWWDPCWKREWNFLSKYFNYKMKIKMMIQLFVWVYKKNSFDPFWIVGFFESVLEIST